MSKRKMHLVGHMCTGPTTHHNGSWRHPDSDADKVLDPSRYQNLARIYERGLFDGVFIVDCAAITDMKEGVRSKAVEVGGQLAMLDPILVLATMACVTSHLGLSATLSTTFNHPYSIARLFATLDHLSGGRAGWNIVTSADDQMARNFGLCQMPEKDLRYDQADQAVEVCMQLWNGWDADALKIDRETGLFADPDKIHFINYDGSMVECHGAFTTPRSPQGHPVLMQAGASSRGRDFAARWAEVIFTHQGAKAEMQAFYRDMKRRVAEAGRNPHDCVILPSIDVIVAKTMKLAQQRASDVDSFASLEAGLQVIAVNLSLDLSQVSLDTPLADIKPHKLMISGLHDNVLALRKDGRGLTLGEAALLQATTWWSPRLLGTAEMVVDEMQDMFESECCDGFIIAQSLSPGGIEEFVDMVVPEIQRRGLYRTAYTGRTFRENLKG